MIKTDLFHSSFSVVAQPEAAELITPNQHEPPNPSPPVSSPTPSVQDLTAPLYLHRQNDKVIVQQADHREETVIQTVPDDKAHNKEMSPVDMGKTTDDEGNGQRQREIQVGCQNLALN